MGVLLEYLFSPRRTKVKVSGGTQTKTNNQVFTCAMMIYGIFNVLKIGQKTTDVGGLG